MAAVAISESRFRSASLKLADFINRSNGRLAILTGAGVSTDSNIPDYRGPKGIYMANKGFKPITYSAFVGTHEAR